MNIVKNLNMLSSPGSGLISGDWNMSRNERMRSIETEHHTRLEVVDDEQLREAVHKVNNTIKLKNTALKIEWNDEIGRKHVVVLDTQSGEVLKEIPAKDFIEWEEAYVELLGMLFDQKI